MDHRISCRARARERRARLPLTASAVAMAACLGAADARAADAAQGKAAFARQCAICHSIEQGGPNGFGPNLFGIVGKKAGTVAGFNYSRAFSTTANWVWSEGLLGPWISLPGVMVPGTTMGIFQGVADHDRDDIVAYLAAQK